MNKEVILLHSPVWHCSLSFCCDNQPHNTHQKQNPLYIFSMLFVTLCTVSMCHVTAVLRLYYLQRKHNRSVPEARHVVTSAVQKQLDISGYKTHSVTCLFTHSAQFYFHTERRIEILSKAVTGKSGDMLRQGEISPFMC